MAKPYSQIKKPGNAFEHILSYMPSSDIELHLIQRIKTPHLQFRSIGQDLRLSYTFYAVLLPHKPYADFWGISGSYGTVQERKGKKQ